MTGIKAQKIKLMVTDVDGVLTNGLIGYGNYNDDYRFFNVRDGFAFVLLKKAGIKTAIITSKSSRALIRRARELKIDMLAQNAGKKLDVFKNMLKKFRIQAEEACYLGDDFLDLAVLQSVGLAVTVPQASAEIKAVVDHVTVANGGEGAFRETAELILKAQEKWSGLVKGYFL